MFKSETYKPSYFARSFSFLLAMSFMVHSGYVNATTMECYSSGKSEVSLEQKEYCCATEALDFEAVSAKCCAFEQTEKVFEGFLSKVEIDLNQISLPAHLVQQADFALPIIQRVDQVSLKSPPDLLSGFALLKFISVFRL